MRITGADYKNGTLMLRVVSPEALRFAKTFKEGEYEICKSAKKRSQNANNFAWELIGKLAREMAIDKDTIYRDAVLAVGAFETLMIRAEAFEDFKRVWADRGLAWIAEKVDSFDGWVEVHAYYGSSSYSTKQMSALIEYLKQDCVSIGIDVDDGRIASLLDEWERTHEG